MRLSLFINNIKSIDLKLILKSWNDRDLFLEHDNRVPFI